MAHTEDSHSKDDLCIGGAATVQTFSKDNKLECFRSCVD